MQLVVQVPLRHTSPLLQLVPHAPQLPGSEFLLVQNADDPVPQRSGLAVVHTHAEPLHCWPAGHLLPHALQLFASTVRFAQ